MKSSLSKPGLRKFVLLYSLTAVFFQHQSIEKTCRGGKTQTSNQMMTLTMHVMIL
jgi:hypothetical protein